MTDYLVIEDTTNNVLGIGAPSSLVVSGQTVRQVSDDLTLNREQILQGATVTLTNGIVTAVTYSSAYSAQQANNALRAFHAQVLEWESGLVKYGTDVYRVGTLYLDSGWQAAKLILGGSTYTDTVATTIFRAAAQGAAQVTSPEFFASSIYAIRSNPSPTRALLWVNATGGRTTLASMVDYGALVAERPFTLPTTWRT